VADPLISVLLPTRGRPKLLRESVGSLHETATKDQAPFEVLYAFDADDEEGLTAYDWLAWNLPGIHRPRIFQQRHGYAGLHIYVNALAGWPYNPGWAGPKGRWLLLWNDDAVMHTYGWNTEIAKWPDRYVLDCWSNHEPRTCAFPVVPRWWVDRLGHFSLNAHNDTWWQEIGERTRRLVRIDVDVYHRRFDLSGDPVLDDETYQDKLEQHQTAEFYTDRVAGRIARDATVIQKLMVAQYEARWQGRADWEREGRTDGAALGPTQ
jgi:hypothetical protein